MIRFLNWTMAIEPMWVGFAIWATTLFTLIMTSTFVIAKTIEYLQWFSLVPIVAFLLYIWIKALFFQRSD